MPRIPDAIHAAILKSGDRIAKNNVLQPYWMITQRRRVISEELVTLYGHYFFDIWLLVTV